MAPSKPINKPDKAVKRKLADEPLVSQRTKAVKKSKILKEPSPDPQSSHSDEEEEEEEEAMLHGLSTDDDDSSDEEVDGPPLDISKLPTIAKDDATLSKRLEKAKKQSVCCFTFALL